MNYWPPLKIGICGDRYLLMCPCAPPNDRNGHGTDDDDDDRADNLIFFSYVIIAGEYSTTSQSFMLLFTREIGYLMMSLFYIAHIRKKPTFWPKAP